MTTWLVTGGAGFIGGNFVLDAVSRGIRIVNLDTLTYAGNLDTLASLEGNEAHVFVQGDIGDGALVERLLAEHRPDAIVNFAAESHVDRSIDGPAAFVHTNVVGTLALLEKARDYWKSLDGPAREAFRFLPFFLVRRAVDISGLSIIKTTDHLNYQRRGLLSALIQQQ